MTENINRTGFTVGDLSGYQSLSCFTNSVTDSDIILVYGDGKCTYINQNGAKTQYNNLPQAIYSVGNFSGNIRFEQDLYQEFESSELSVRSNFAWINVFDKNLVFDLNNHSWIINRNDDNALSVFRFMLEYGSTSKVTIKNGTLSCHNLQMLYLYGGEFRIENSDIYSNSRMDVRPGEMSRCFFYVDRLSKMTFTYDWYSTYNVGGNGNHNPGIWAFGTSVKNYENWENYKRTEGESGIYKFIEDLDYYMPTVYVEGKLVSNIGINEDQTRTCDLIFTSGNSDMMPVKYVVGKDAVLHAFNGTALFINNCGKIILNGGKIYGKTPVVLRSGILSVSQDANPFLYGTGNGAYDPTIPTGQGTSMLNELGNAVVIESVGGSYGKYPSLDGNRLTCGEYPSAVINSGEYYSLYNSPIGSYGHTNTAGGYHPRLSAFMHGGIISKEPSTQEYVWENGGNSDYAILEDGYITTNICEIKKQEEN